MTTGIENLGWILFILAREPPLFLAVAVLVDMSAAAASIPGW
jgi:hypothetical protein